jgi:glycosyltransferase involved in cell wall biosynthesis
MQPRVSVLIPCYNAEKWLAQAVESALAQEGPAVEVIVVNDGSTDASLDAIRKFDGRIRWESGPNKGAPAARNRLLEMSRGEWLQFLDADDYLRPHKVARQLAVAERSSDCDLVYSASIIEQRHGDKFVLVNDAIPEPRDPWILLGHWYLPQTGGALWRKSALQRVGGWRVDQPCCQEHELYFRMLCAGCRFEYCDGNMSIYRYWEHGGRLSDRMRDEVHKQRLLILDRIEKHLLASGQINDARRQAINDTRHAEARMLWRGDPAWALRVVDSIRESDPSYCPINQRHAPPLYSLIYRLFGFKAAQILAFWRRQAAALFFMAGVARSNDRQGK